MSTKTNFQAKFTEYQGLKFIIMPPQIDVSFFDTYLSYLKILNEIVILQKNTIPGGKNHQLSGFIKSIQEDKIVIWDYAKASTSTHSGTDDSTYLGFSLTEDSITSINKTDIIAFSYN
jgi:hypothetical protein